MTDTISHDANASLPDAVKTIKFSCSILQYAYQITCVGSACCPAFRCEKCVIGAPIGICCVSEVNTTRSQSILIEFFCSLMPNGTISHLHGVRND
jgi:hypothetical protein